MKRKNEQLHLCPANQLFIIIYSFSLYLPIVPTTSARMSSTIAGWPQVTKHIEPCASSISSLMMVFIFGLPSRKCTWDNWAMIASLTEFGSYLEVISLFVTTIVALSSNEAFSYKLVVAVVAPSKFFCAVTFTRNNSRTQLIDICIGVWFGYKHCDFDVMEFFNSFNSSYNQ